MMENQPGLAVSGTSVVLPQCPKCDRKNARGVQFTREVDGAVIFKCDACGQKRKLGHDEQHALLIDKEAEDYKRAVANRERYMRESDERFNETYKDAVENFKAEPDIVDNFYASHQGLMLERERQMQELEKGPQA